MSARFSYYANSWWVSLAVEIEYTSPIHSGPAAGLDLGVKDRKDAIDKATTQIARQYSLIGLETLNVKGMLQNHNLAQAISDASPGQITRQLDYKAEGAGGRTLYIGQFFPSSKLHHGCGWRNEELKLSDRQWLYLGCGEVVDRDWNAALNIRDEALRLVSA
jgi:putative transposase